MSQLYLEFILLILGGRAASSTVLVSAVLLHKLKKLVCSEEHISS